VTRTIAGGPEQSQSDNITEGFVQTHGLGICRGRYAKTLIKEWHRWDHLHESENDAVDGFHGDQLYVVFVFADGGADLERFELRSFEEAQSILLQVRARANSKPACIQEELGHTSSFSSFELPDDIVFPFLLQQQACMRTFDCLSRETFSALGNGKPSHFWKESTESLHLRVYPKYAFPCSSFSPLSPPSSMLLTLHVTGHCLCCHHVSSAS